MPTDIRQLDQNFAAPDAENADLLWYDIRELGVDGRAFDDTKSFYDRLPARAEGVVRDPVWSLAQHSAGMCVRFETDAPEISVRWRVRFDALAMAHMPATGVSGLDVYGWTDHGWHFAGSARPEQFPENRAVIAPDLDGQNRAYLMYLPLYNGTEKVEVGLPRGASLASADEPGNTNSKPVVCYGTSIVQGGCASRPGMAYPAIIGRMLNRRTVNLGFSGNGQAEPEMASLLAEIDAAAYVLDPLPNLQPAQVTERIEPFVRILREAQPTTPIVLVENITYQVGALRKASFDRYTQSNANLRAAYRRLLDAGVADLHYIPGNNLLGQGSDATVDGTHPTDMGFQRMAEVIAPVLKPLV